MDGEPAPVGGPRLGLALSGGGHRAAFFHIGVLAALAELGLLRQVRVLSTVSGGSLIGALYYLHVKTLLETKDDGTITDDDFVEIVHDVAREYRAAVAKNLLASTYLNLGKNFAMASRSYTRTDRMGELLEEDYYRQAWHGPLVNGRIPMRDLLINPGGTAIDPDSEENAGRNAPVPILLLEATCLNTGHNWRFEAEYMGEPDRQSDAPVETDVDKNEQLKRAKWDALPEKLRDFPLGAAVAASAAFPPSFAPLPINDLYPGIVVELSDGGIHDNQGVEGLVDRACTHIIISDGSGQMPDVQQPGTWIPAVLSRASTVYGDVERQQRLLRAFAEKKWAFFHLLSGLPDKTREPGGGTVTHPGGMTTADFGVDPAVQQQLAYVRTSLDAFNDVEAWGLAKDGHAIAKYVTPLRPEVQALANPIPLQVDWPWDAVAVAEPDEELLADLAADGGKQETLGFYAPLGLMALVVAGLGSWLLYPHGVTLLVLLFATFVGLGSYFAPANRFSAVLFESVMPAVLAVPLWVASLCMRYVGNRWLTRGRVGAG
ncbi:MAG TPA: patatin-like phospholipase family protein [Gaiellaceae bacterium]